MIKYWILKTFFESELKEATTRGSIDAFEKARKDLEETNVYDTDTKAEALAKQKLIDLLSPIDDRSIVTLDKTNRIVFVGGERADDGRLNNLKAEAEFFEQSDLWKIIVNTPKRLAEKAMFVDDGKVENQLIKGRAMLYLLDSQQNIVSIFKSYEPKK